MHAADRVRLQHMIEAADSAVQFMAGRQRTELETDRMLLFAVVRAIEIIGEAASKISEATQTAEPGIPWKAIIGMRNRLVHAYFQINTDVVWKTATQEIPAVMPLLRALAEKA